MEADKTLEFAPFPQDRPNAHLAAQRAISTKTPFDVLGKADQNWKRTHKDALFGRSYTAATPSVWANQQLGLITQTHIATHIKTSFNKIHFDTTMRPSQELADETGDNLDEWKAFEGPLNDDIYYDDLHGLDETARTQLEDIRMTDVSRPDRKSKLHKNTHSHSLGSREGASTTVTFDAG